MMDWVFTYIYKGSNTIQYAWKEWGKYPYCDKNQKYLTLFRNFEMFTATWKTNGRPLNTQLAEYALSQWSTWRLCAMPSHKIIFYCLQSHQLLINYNLIYDSVVAQLWKDYRQQGLDQQLLIRGRKHQKKTQERSQTSLKVGDSLGWRNLLALG